MLSLTEYADEAGGR